MRKNLEEIAACDGRFNPDALEFVYEGLGHTVKMLQRDGDDAPSRHVSGADLSYGLRDLALQKWGRLAKLVLHGWGIRSTRDFGEAVYLMIAHQWMSAQPSDTIDDFNCVFDFKAAFEDRYELEHKDLR